MEIRRPYQTNELKGALHWVASTIGLVVAFLQNGDVVPSDSANILKFAVKQLGLKELLNLQFCKQAPSA